MHFKKYLISSKYISFFWNLTFITLTDGSSNSNYYINNVVNTEEGLQQSKADTGTPVVKVGKKQYTIKSKDHYYRSSITTGLLL